MYSAVVKYQGKNIAVLTVVLAVLGRLMGHLLDSQRPSIQLNGAHCQWGQQPPNGGVPITAPLLASWTILIERSRRSQNRGPTLRCHERIITALELRLLPAGLGRVAIGGTESESRGRGCPQRAWSSRVPCQSGSSVCCRAASSGPGVLGCPVGRVVRVVVGLGVPSRLGSPISMGKSEPAPLVRLQRSELELASPIGLGMSKSGSASPDGS